MFTKRATLNELAQIVKNGGLTEEQTHYLETSEPENDSKNGEEVEDNVVVDNPICPWFTCCY